MHHQGWVDQDLGGPGTGSRTGRDTRTRPPPAAVHTPGRRLDMPASARRRMSRPTTARGDAAARWLVSGTDCTSRPPTQRWHLQAFCANIGGGDFWDGNVVTGNGRSSITWCGGYAYYPYFIIDP